MKRVVLTGIYTIHARYASTVVNLMIFVINASRLASMCAQTAFGTFPGIEYGMKQREARDKSQNGAHWTNGVAIGTSVAPSQHDDCNEACCRDDESRQTAQPHISFVESIAVGTFGQEGQQVVAPDIYRLKQVLYDASVRTVRSEQCHQGANACDQGNDKEGKNAISQPLYFRRV